MSVDDDYTAALASPDPFPVRRLLAQLDLDGAAHEIAPPTEAMRLFNPAPAPIAGQTLIPTEEVDR